MIEVAVRPKKRLFVSLIIASLCLAMLSIYGIWMVSFPGLKSISSFLPLILGTLLGLVVIAIASGVVGIILAILGFPTPKFFQSLAWSAINLLFPLATRIGRLFDVEKERVERSFIEMSNHLIKQKHIKVSPEKLLILSPHCIQQESCPHKITRDINNCRCCGGCQVGDLLKLSRSLGVNVTLVTGGTLARKVIKTIRPHVVIAIACERDLTSGIQDTFPLPVIGVLNERPYGPCCNTRVSIKQVESTVRELINIKQGDANECPRDCSENYK